MVGCLATKLLEINQFASSAGIACEAKMPSYGLVTGQGDEARYRCCNGGEKAERSMRLT